MYKFSSFNLCLLATFGIVLVSLCCVNVSAVEIPDPPDDKCIKNKTLPADAEDNYMDCLLQESKDAGTTDCCSTGRGASIQVGCCVPEGGLGRMAYIGIGIGCTTAVLMVIVFVVFWCDESTFPCLKKCKKRCAPCACCECCCCHEEKLTKQQEVEMMVTKDGLTNPSYGSTPQEQQTPQYDTPDHLKVEVKEDFFG